MPARSRLSQASLLHDQRESDDSSHSFLASGKKQYKGRKMNGLNNRMSSMLQRANTSYTADLPGPKTTKRPRYNSDRSSSSALSSEIPKTPIDAIHRAAQGNSLGSDFSLLKHSSPPFKLKENLPSWRGEVEENVEGSKKVYLLR